MDRGRVLRSRLAPPARWKPAPLLARRRRASAATSAPTNPRPRAGPGTACPRRDPPVRHPVLRRRSPHSGQAECSPGTPGLPGGTRRRRCRARGERPADRRCSWLWHLPRPVGNVVHSDEAERAGRADTAPRRQVPAATDGGGDAAGGIQTGNGPAVLAQDAGPTVVPEASERSDIAPVHRDTAEGTLANGVE